MAFFTHTMSGILAKGLVIRDKFVNFIPAKFSRTQSKHPTYEKNIRTTALVVRALARRPAARRRPAYPTVQRLAHRRHCTGIARRFRRAPGRVRQRTLFLAQRRHAPARPHERHPRYARHIGPIGLFGKLYPQKRQHRLRRTQKRLRDVRTHRAGRTESLLAGLVGVLELVFRRLCRSGHGPGLGRLYGRLVRERLLSR